MQTNTTAKQEKKPDRTPKVIDITAEAVKKAKKDYVEVKVKFKGEHDEYVVKGQSMVQIHGKLAAMCEERGKNYKTAFEYHEVIQ